MMRPIFCLFFVSAILLDGISQSQAQKPKTLPTVLVRGPLGVVSRCVSEGDDIYWLEGDKNILYVKKVGGYPAPLVRTNIKIETFTVDSTGVYYLSQNKYEWGENEQDFTSQGELRTTGKKRAITTLLPNFGIPASTFVTSDATDIYLFAVSKEQSGEIIKVPKTGGEPKYVASRIVSTVSSAAVDEKNVYWLDVLNNSVFQVAKTGGERKILFKQEDSSFEPLMIATSDDYLYLVTRRNDIYQISKADGSARLLYSGKGSQFYGPSLVVDGGYIYWQENNSLMRMSKSGGDATVLLRDVSPTCITFDDKYVYWFEDNKGLLRAEK